MKKNEIVRSAVVSAVLCFSTMAGLVGRASADDLPYRDDGAGVSLGGRAAMFDPKGSDNETWFGGAQLRFYLSPTFALEGSVDYREDDFANNAVKVRTWPVQATLMANLIPNQPISLFILGGGGWYFTTIEVGDNEDTDDRFGVHAGAGLQAWLNRYWSLDGTYRYIWLEDLTTDDASLADKEFEDSGNMITIGLNYHF